ncbi:DNA primase [bacterium]|nr:DNA primase [bacterium]
MTNSFSSIAQQSIEQVRHYSGMVEIISQYVSLKKRGKNHLGLCPFHSEKSPSFTVSPEKKLWHCFGCQESGDLISFLQKIDNLTFKEAIENIASYAGIEIERTESKNSGYSSENDKLKETLRDLLIYSREYFKQQLSKSKNDMNYLVNRGLSAEIIQQYNVGYSPNNNDILTVLKNHGFSDSDIKSAGMGVLSEKGYLYSRFRERIMFPISDHLGRLVGFSGRVLPANQSPAKYLNSEETLIFNKRSVLYGLDQAKKHVNKAGFIIVTEGFFDALMIIDNGFPNTIASMGTALTDNHIRLLSRMTKSIILAFDNDGAGQKAAQKAISLIAPFNMNVRVLRYKENDPSDFLVTHGKEAFTHALENAMPSIDFMFHTFKIQEKILDVQGISSIVKNLVPYLKMLTDPIVLRHYVSKYSRELKIDETLVMAKLKNKSYNLKRNFYSLNQKEDKQFKAEEMLIYFMANDLETKKLILSSTSVDLIKTKEFKEIFKEIASIPLSGKDLIDSLKEKNKPVLIKIFVNMSNKYDEPTSYSWKDCIRTLQNSIKKESIERLKQRIEHEEENNNNDEVLNRLLLDLQQLIQSMKEK